MDLGMLLVRILSHASFFVIGVPHLVSGSRGVLVWGTLSKCVTHLSFQHCAYLSTNWVWGRALDVVTDAETSVILIRNMALLQMHLVMLCLLWVLDDNQSLNKTVQCFISSLFLDINWWHNNCVKNMYLLCVCIREGKLEQLSYFTNTNLPIFCGC